MKAFHFSLEPLRVLRRQKEEMAQQHYARALAACKQAELKLQDAAAELAAGWNMRHQELERGIISERLAGLQTWCAVLKARRNECQTALDEARRAAGLALQKMSLAVHEREILDRFYDKSRYAYAANVEREEQKTLDELAVQLSGSPGLLKFPGRKN
jgi:flagellar export protein FliJ